MGDDLLGMIMDLSDSDSDVSDLIMLNMLCRSELNSSDEESNQSENGDDDASDTDDLSCFSGDSSSGGVELEDEASVSGPHCSVCSKAITGFVFVCVQCNVRACGACDARGQHAQHYVLRAPCGSAEEELKEVVIKVREAISSAGLELSPAPRAQRTKDDGKEQADEQEDDENSYGNFELKTEIKLEVDVDDEDPLRSSEYEDIYSSSAPEASGSQVVPEPKEVKTELPDTPTASHSQTSSAGAASPPSPRSPRSPPSPSPPSPPSADSDDSKPLAKRKRVISESMSPAATMKPGKRKSTSENAASRNLSTKERERIVALHELGRNITQISQELGFSRYTVRLWVRRYKEEGQLVDRPRAPHPYIIKESQTQEMVKRYEVEPFTPTRVFAQKFDCSLRTVRRALHRAGMRCTTQDPQQKESEHK